MYFDICMFLKIHNLDACVDYVTINVQLESPYSKSPEDTEAGQLCSSWIPIVKAYAPGICDCIASEYSKTWPLYVAYIYEMWIQLQDV